MHGKKLKEKELCFCTFRNFENNLLDMNFTYSTSVDSPVPFPQKHNRLNAKKKHWDFCCACAHSSMIFFKGRKQGKQLGPTPFASCKQCFLRNQGYCIEVEMGEETIRKWGERGDEQAKLQHTSKTTVCWDVWMRTRRQLLESGSKRGKKMLWVEKSEGKEASGAKCVKGQHNSAPEGWVQQLSNLSNTNRRW